MALAKKTKLESAIEDLASEESRLNRELDHVNAQIRANSAEHNAPDEIAAAVRETIRQGADRYRVRLKVELSEQDLAKLNIMPVQVIDYQPGMRVALTPPDLGLLADGFHFLLESTPGAIENILKQAPVGGIAKGECERIAATLEAKKLSIETSLENLYETMQRAGFQPRRRPDMSPAVLLGFKDKADWNQQKLEAYRQRSGEIRGAQRKLGERRNELIQERGKLERLAEMDKDGAQQFKSDIAKLNHEEKALNDRIAVAEQERKRSEKIWNNCIQFLRDQGLKVDAHI